MSDGGCGCGSGDRHAKEKTQDCTCFLFATVLALFGHRQFPRTRREREIRKKRPHLEARRRSCQTEPPTAEMEQFREGQRAVSRLSLRR
jgi:hypothetical protein